MEPRFNRIPIRQDAVERWKPAEAVTRPVSSGVARFILQLFLCIGPTAGLLAIGRASLAGYWFWGMLVLLLLRLVFTGRKDEMLCLLLATAPFINLLRSFAFYNVVVVLYGGAFLLYGLMARAVVWKTMRQFPLLLALFLYFTVYYAASVYNTHEYSINLRLFELAFTITFVLVLGRSRTELGKALVGWIVSAIFVGGCLLPFFQGARVMRLGLIELEGNVLGNPTQLGIPLAFGFLALIVDQGRWLGVRPRSLWRLWLLLMVVPLLALTTSRAAWLVAFTGLTVCLVLASKQRLKILAAGLVVMLALVGVMFTPYRTTFEKGINRTFGETRSLRQKTSGRSDQWKVAYYAFSRNADSIIHGYGPGTGPEVYATYSVEVPDVRYGFGKKVALHSLFMQIGVEAGLLGLGVLSMILLILFVKILMNQSGLLIPLVCFLGYVVIIVTVSGNDINSGAFFGVALLGTKLRRNLGVARGRTVTSESDVDARKALET